MRAWLHTPIAAALATLSPVGVFAAETAGMSLDCTAAGYDVLLSNPGEKTVEPGAFAAWEVRFVRKSGRFEIEEALEPGGSVFISGALGSDYLSSPQPCTAVIETG